MYPDANSDVETNGGKSSSFFSPTGKVVRHSSWKSFSAEAGRRKVSLKDLHLPALPVQRSRSFVDINAFNGFDGGPVLSLMRPKGALDSENEQQFDDDSHSGEGRLVNEDISKLRRDNARLISAIRKMSTIMQKTKSGFNAYLSKYKELQQYCASLEAENSALHMHIDNLSAQLEFAYYGVGSLDTVFYNQEANDVYSGPDTAYPNQDFAYDANEGHNLELLYADHENIQNERLGTTEELDEEELAQQYEDLEPKPVLQL
eukprot:CAMPEP_0204834500 /NCGR_PEP_ID=MMETSP1346-20131115/20019_1 /ASSEMBLY_ACC=CAM_ASM_000771 /TAXON_ID=215587 /ORGANISM="Aplanochytrium stocchinoi, Strain GSBS06" /LENGTH=259 /DNA_ID=CAMNT_0051967859 /DNA_START=502 /DNA_END=1281 /DNA_ORIENTATION=+